MYTDYMQKMTHKLQVEEHFVHTSKLSNHTTPEHCSKLVYLSAHQPHMVSPELAEIVQHASVAPEIEDNA